ncbi:uncharacterized protein LOC125874113 [Solanum stenotomum]|uniref:uncharacterized protein LOC125874113 n=1 Tax=Solanum stenotomum TaxID=172797 RepID=UPI0020D1068E|nr:uncharacterized protein LOC125874113 [Solanum stenotomum]
MEGGLSVSTPSLYSGLKCYWKRRRRGGYERLNGSGCRRKNRVGLGRGRFWKINLKPRPNLKLRRFSPKKLLLNMRDAYVNMMMKIANSRCMSSGIGGGFGTRQLKEYDEKMLVEIYKSMIIAQGQLVARDGVGVGVSAGAGAVKFGTPILCQR